MVKTHNIPPGNVAACHKLFPPFFYTFNKDNIPLINLHSQILISVDLIELTFVCWVQRKNNLLLKKKRVWVCSGGGGVSSVTRKMM